MSKTLPPAVFATNRLSPSQPPKTPPTVTNTGLVAKTPFLIDDILHQHHTTAHNNKHTNNNNNPSASHFETSGGGVPGKPANVFANCSYSSNAMRNGDLNHKSSNKSSNDCASVGGHGTKGITRDGTHGIFQEAEQLMIRSAEEDYRRYNER